MLDTSIPSLSANIANSTDRNHSLELHESFSGLTDRPTPCRRLEDGLYIFLSWSSAEGYECVGMRWTVCGAHPRTASV